MANDLAGLVPEVAKLIPVSQPVVSLRGAQARFRLFDELTAVLKALSCKQPIVVALDDLHWADTSSLQLLQFVAREIGDAALLLIGTYRDIDLGPEHPFASTLGVLARVELSLRLRLVGLSEDEVAQVIALAAGRQPPPTLAAAVWKKSDGNPFFVTEIARLLSASADAASTNGKEPTVPIPPTVREATALRLRSLPKASQLLLRLAAVIGRSFDLTLLMEAATTVLARRPRTGFEARLAAALAAAVDQRLIAAEEQGHFCFVHALTREAIYEQLSGRERIGFHHAVGAAMESLAGGSVDERAAELANHFSYIGKRSDVPRAIRYATLAARRAAHLYAYEEAAALYERALRLAERHASATERAALLLDLGHNQWKAGDFNRARATFVAAADIARRAGDAQQLARAALGYGGGFRGFDVGVVEPVLVDLLEEALLGLHDVDGALRGQVLARLAVALYDVPGSFDRRNALSAEAVTVAQRHGDDDAHLGALYSRHWAIWGPDNLDDRFAAADAMVALAARTRDDEMGLHAHRFRFIDRVERADFAAADEDLERCGWLAEKLRQPYYHWYVETFRAMRALASGPLDKAEEHIHRALAIGQRAQSRNVMPTFGAQMMKLRREQGRLSEVVPTLRDLVAQYPKVAVWRCGLAYALSEVGHREEAGFHFDLVAADEFAALTRDCFWLVGVLIMADVCVFLEDRKRARPLYAQLRPYASRIATNVGAVCYGSTARGLGRLAALLGDWPAAAEHFKAALRREQRCGWPLPLAHTQREYGQALFTAGRERDRAADLLAQAQATFLRFGMQSFLR